GMIEATQRDLNIGTSHSFMVGDKHSDIVFAGSVGMKGILIKTGYGLGEVDEWYHDWNEHPDYIAQDLLDAVEWISCRW
ncbi:MAG: HAD hydrolase-like protein, partial [Gemmatimonadales bacterium]|nr:HAD hydrolase-like protein [Gemmatimonadales bacterium]NIP07951.1 HAD hydrolase-like protein [Gemmatimonadales bacterium]NIR03230.1 HAD hydrolase-like protein [Gemmatimonadales bacterium]NIS66919.1 HAD hydrolase-like protein [Gemmatimonadales bacterium]